MSATSTSWPGPSFKVHTNRVALNKDHPQHDTIRQMSEERWQEEQLRTSAVTICLILSDLEMNGQAGSVLPAEQNILSFPALSYFRFSIEIFTPSEALCILMYTFCMEVRLMPLIPRCFWNLHGFFTSRTSLPKPSLSSVSISASNSLICQDGQTRNVYAILQTFLFHTLWLRLSWFLFLCSHNLLIFAS